MPSYRSSNMPAITDNEQKSPYAIDVIWPELDEGINQIFVLHAPMSRGSFMKLYTHVYNHCTSVVSPAVECNATRARNSDGAYLIGYDLYQRISKFLAKYTESLRRESSALVDEELLNFYANKWNDYRFSSLVLNGICSYLNRHWVRREYEEGRKTTMEIFQLALVAWRDYFFKPIATPLVNSLLNLIERERLGETVPTSLINKIIASFLELGLKEDEHPDYRGPQLTVYQNYFEKPFLKVTEQFYHNESIRFLDEHRILEYIKKVEQRHEEEKSRISKYLHESTFPKLIEVCEQELIKKHLNLLYAEFKLLLEGEREEEICRLFRLMSTIKEAKIEMKNTLQEHIVSAGLSAIQKCPNTPVIDPKMYASAALGIHRQYKKLIATAFDNDSSFVAALDKACGRFINDNSVTRKSSASSSKSPELLARYCDQLLKKSSKNVEESELEEELTHIMVVFKYLEDKDIFLKFYCNMLAKRLVNQMSASDDAEASMISKLKTTCGFEYTSKLLRMYQDIHTSKDLNEAFRKTQQGNREALDIDFTTLVLASNAWPFSNAESMTLPTELERCITKWTNFYSVKHSGRKLMWVYNRSKGELATNGFVNKYTFQTSTFQMGVLLLYNDVDQLTATQINDVVRLKRDILFQVLNTLVKSKLLLVDGEDNAVTMNSKLTLNEAYKNKRLKVNINVPIKVECKTEQEGTYKNIEDDRKILIQAAIVRIMKTRKTLKHQILVAEVLTQLNHRFKPTIPNIKRCIDVLIEKEYLARVDNEKDIYTYLA